MSHVPFFTLLLEISFRCRWVLRKKKLCGSSPNFPSHIGAKLLRSEMPEDADCAPACEIRAGDTVEVKALPLRWATILALFGCNNNLLAQVSLETKPP